MYCLSQELSFQYIIAYILRIQEPTMSKSLEVIGGSLEDENQYSNIEVQMDLSMQLYVLP